MAVKILMVASCNHRGKGPVAYIGDLISNLKAKDNSLQIDLFVTSMASKSTQDEFEVDNFAFPQFRGVWTLIKKIPRVRVLIWNGILRKSYKTLLYKEKYDYIVFHSIPTFASKFVQIAKSRGAKIVLYPWGSEILRAPENVLRKFKYAFENADYIRGDSTALCEKINRNYHVSKDVYKNILYGSSVITKIKQFKGVLERETLVQKLGLPKAAFYIVCGYNAYKGQCHEEIINQLTLIKDKLPHDYMLIFPMTYGVGADPKELKKLCDLYGLKAVILTDYISDEEMACLHILADVFIHVQKTDLASSFLTESIYSETSIINGSWLSYNNLQKYGNPYYMVDSIENLHHTLSKFFENSIDKVNIDDRLLKEIEEESWEQVIINWISLFNS